MKLIVLLLLLNVAWAHQETNDTPCIVPIPAVMSTEGLKKLVEQLEWWGASKAQVKAAPCKATQVPLESEMTALVNTKATGAKKNETVFGVKLTQESPVLIQAFKDLTTRRSLYGGPWYAPEEAQVQIQQVYAINPACDKVLCAIDKIWGAGLGRKILHLYLKHGFNASELAFDSADRFKEEELNDVMLAADDLTPHMQPLGSRKNQRLVPFTPGYTLQDYDSSVLANSGVILFDSWRKKDSITRQYTTFHELAHNMSDRNQNADSSAEWLALSGWKKTGDDWSAGDAACMISKYGQSNPYEDFAEVATAYRYNAPGLEEKCPDKYRYMKEKIFKGVEYKDSSQCVGMANEKLKKAHEALTLAVSSMLAEADISKEDVAKSCAEVFTQYPVNDEESGSCALRSSLAKLPDSVLVSSLQQAGLPDSALNRRLVLESWAQSASKQSEIASKLFALQGSVSNAVETIILESQLASIPKNSQVPANNNIVWYTAKKDCGRVLASNPAEFKSCLSEKIVKEDEERSVWNGGYFDKYQPPAIFTEKATASLTNANRSFMKVELSNLSAMQQQLQQAQADFKKDLNQFVSTTEYQTKSSLGTNWRALSPQQFCAQTYGVGSVFLNSWGLQNKSLPQLKQKCEEMQQGKPQRSFFTAAEGKALVESILP